MPNKKKKRKIEIIGMLQTEVKQLTAALNESRKYADKLVDHIPYLPADIENLRAANLHFSKEIEALKKENDELSLLIKPALEIARQFTLCDEFPGPYKLESTASVHRIYSRSGDIVATTCYSDFATFILNTLNAVDTQLALGE
jgi:FtsZ-binding cell division protein ZapB